MKTTEIAKKYNIDADNFFYFLQQAKLKYNEGLISITVADENVDLYVKKYMEFLKNKKEEQLKLKEEEKKKNQALSKILITSGFNFDGYTITKYSGYISGDDAISIDRGLSGFFTSATNVSNSLTDSLVKIRRQAIKELKEAAYNLGCNAVIGVDFDYITLEPETANSYGGTTYLSYVFCVTANGNAVIIEKNEDLEKKKTENVNKVEQPE